jgi:hypothetical protein
MHLRKLLIAYLLVFCISSLWAQEPKITVMNPKGTPPPIRLVPMAPRLDSLDGKTVYFVDVRYVGADTFLKEMMSWFTANMPKVKLQFRQKAGAYAENDPQLWEEIRQKGDAVVMAIGH